MPRKLLMDRSSAVTRLSETQLQARLSNVSARLRLLLRLQRPKSVLKKEVNVSAKAVMCSMDMLLMINLNQFSKLQKDFKLTLMVRNKSLLDQKLSAAVTNSETLLTENLNLASVLNQKRRLTNSIKILWLKSVPMKAASATAHPQFISVSLERTSQI
jgi:hypothetical protein